MTALTSLDTVILPLTPIAALVTGGNDLAPFDKGSYQIVYDYSGGGTSAGSINLQTSDDGVNYVNYPSGSVSFTSSSTSDMFEFTSIGFKFSRLQVTITSGTGGNFSIRAHFLRTY